MMNKLSEETKKQTEQIDRYVNNSVAVPEKNVVKKDNDFNNEIASLIYKAGTIKLTEKQKAILYADVKEEDVEIRPDGLVYLPWMEYATRLRKAFGMGWAMIPQGLPKLDNNLVLWGHSLIVNGCPMGFSIGQQEYKPTNKKMTYGDAIEGAKSNALMRVCKGIGMTLELWKPSWIWKWKKKYAETYMFTNKYSGEEKEQWRKKAEEETETSQNAPEYTQKEKATPTPKEKKKKATVPKEEQVADTKVIEFAQKVTEEEIPYICTVKDGLSESQFTLIKRNKWVLLTIKEMSLAPLRHTLH